MKLHMGFQLAYLDLALAYSEGQLDCRNSVSLNFLALFLYNITFKLCNIISVIYRCVIFASNMQADAGFCPLRLDDCLLHVNGRPSSSRTRGSRSRHTEEIAPADATAAETLHKSWRGPASFVSRRCNFNCERQPHGMFDWPLATRGLWLFLTNCMEVIYSLVSLWLNALEKMLICEYVGSFSHLIAIPLVSEEEMLSIHAFPN